MKASHLEVATFWVDLVGVVLTLGALAVAIYLGWRELQQFRVEVEHRGREAEAAAVDRRRSQAERVSAVVWVSEKATSVHRVVNGSLQSAPSYTTLVEVHNTSEQPIYDVEAFIGAEDEATGTVVITRLDPRPVIPGGQVYKFAAPTQIGRELDGLPAGVYFRDAANRDWLRRLNGEIRESPREHPRRAVDWDWPDDGE